jgi:hypothetical protein
MRTALLALVATVILAVPAAALALPGHEVLCSQSCSSPGGGFTGCVDQQAAHSAKVTAIAGISHFVVVHYCKSYGRLTSLSIVAHGCDTNGLVACSTGPAWVTSGGVGYYSASVEAHATWHVTPLGIYTGTDVVTLTIPTG